MSRTAPSSVHRTDCPSVAAARPSYLGVFLALALLVEFPSTSQPRLHPRGDDLVRHVDAGLQVLGARAECRGKSVGVRREEGAQVAGARLRDAQELL